MRRMKCMAMPLVGLALLSLFLWTADAAGAPPKPRLQWHYYRNSCRYAEEYVRHQVEIFHKQDPSISPKLARLAYSDCFINGCDGSILLDEGPNPEKKAPQNRGLGGFALIDKIRTVLNSRCPGVVSCADILQLATRDAMKLAGAPSYPVFTGRRDGMKSDAASVDLPSPSITWQKGLSYFQSKGLNVQDMTTLLGAHSMGRTHCSYVVDRLYNFNGSGKPDPSMNATILNSLRKQCPPRKRGDHDPLVYLDPESGPKSSFSSSYYKRILSHEAVLEIDQQLAYGNDTLQITEEFAAGFEDFRRAFAYSMYKMGNINVLTGSQGEIRQNCRYTNKGKSN
ncbi:putative peroxidase 26 [Stylosanthes scabra]|uniref:Peroxidase n=1 Tax=Stylosanthes scabra TaxID=79078 RepID=A0ABU6VB57_9FABA|nr:putative peroxidase 26 [Stylosanthes scabra]